MLPHRFNIPTIREFYGSTEGTYGTINIRNKEVGQRWKRGENNKERGENNKKQKTSETKRWVTDGREVDMSKNN